SYRPSTRVAATSERLRQADGLQHRARLVHTLAMLGRGIRVGDDPGPRLHVDAAAAEEREADRDRRVHRAREREVADGATVDPASHGLELLDDLHRADLGRAGERPRREGRAERVEAVAAGEEPPADVRDEVHDVRVALDDE